MATTLTIGFIKLFGRHSQFGILETSRPKLTAIPIPFLSKNVKVLRSIGPKFRKNSARMDFATFQDELKPKFVAKIQLKLG